MENSKKITRRKFIDRSVKSTVGLIGYSLINNSSSHSANTLFAKSKVVIVKDENVTEKYNIKHEIAQIMVDAGIKETTGISNVGEAWKSLFTGITKDKIISIKINCINSSMSSHPEIAYAIANSLTQMEVDGQPFPEENIIIWDRTSGELRNAGYSINKSDSGIKCYGTDSSYSSENYDVAGRSQKISKILTETSDYMINLSILKNHSMAGITISMKNHFGTCNNPGGIHSNYCNPYLPALNSLAPIKEKQVLCICDAIFGIISGGPSGSPQIVPNSLIFSKDSVAIDSVARQILKDNGCKTTNIANHVDTAASAPYNLGTNDPNQIELIEIENPSINLNMNSAEKTNPEIFALSQNYPNPFNASTTICYQLKKSAHINLRIYNIKGEFIKELTNQYQTDGYYRKTWDGTNNNDLMMPSGTYLAQLRAENEYLTIRMQFVK